MDLDFASDSVLSRWISPYYLRRSTIENIRQSVLAKPSMQYAVLDDFYREEALETLVIAHPGLPFSAENDRRAADGVWLPYDGAVHFASRDSVGGDLFFHVRWHEYCAYLISARLKTPCNTEIKLRYHRPYADGFWIHSDGNIRQFVAICYFNKGWEACDGGLLQLWRLDETLAAGVPEFQATTGRMDFLTHHRRLRTSTPGGGGEYGISGPRDFVLVDQIVPTYNRLFLCNFQSDPCFHSVSPSNAKVRYGFVQWIGV